ncbi:MAG: DUF4922 domain-containing protein [Prevotella sp.]
MTDKFFMDVPRDDFKRDKGSPADGAEQLIGDALNCFRDMQLNEWPEVRLRYEALQQVKTKTLSIGHFQAIVQYNPARMVSTGAQIDPEHLRQRPCFLCKGNRPKEQNALNTDSDFEMMVNPYPILPIHFTIPLCEHKPQLISPYYGEIHRLLERFPKLTVFYNGPLSGASAPDHMHFQAVEGDALPLRIYLLQHPEAIQCVVSGPEKSSLSIINGLPFHAFVIRSHIGDTEEQLFRRLLHTLPQRAGQIEPMMNILGWQQRDECYTVVIPRKKLRPDCYFAGEETKMVISPGTLDMAGLVITPREEDFNRLSVEQLKNIYEEMMITNQDMKQTINQLTDTSDTQSAVSGLEKRSTEPTVTVGIVSANEIHFTLNQPYQVNHQTVSGAQTVKMVDGKISWQGATYHQLEFVPIQDEDSFAINDVTIGVDFHWERKETQTFLGTLRLVVDGNRICAINDLTVERYLESVISSEMKATSSLQLLKAHAVISRSWLLAQITKRKSLAENLHVAPSFVQTADEFIKWYDREDHTLFDVCADDHCQRYQGITKETSPFVQKAVHETHGQILMYEHEICDARFSKSCGGITEEFEYCWEDDHKPYLKALRDLKQPFGEELPITDLTVEENAEKWIRTAPDAFCNTQDKKILSQVLNDYDQETADFYRWKVAYTQGELRKLIEKKLKQDFGQILDMVPIERGKSGRLTKLKIVGSQKSLTIGKELEIRRTLSESHLYSSAFVVDKEDILDGIPQKFILVGAGWGHGVGLCQIGAAVMGEKGYPYNEILSHYYPGATIEEIY